MLLSFIPIWPWNSRIRRLPFFNVSVKRKHPVYNKPLQRIYDGNFFPVIVVVVVSLSFGYFCCILSSTCPHFAIHFHRSGVRRPSAHTMCLGVPVSLFLVCKCLFCCGTVFFIDGLP